MYLDPALLGRYQRLWALMRDVNLWVISNPRVLKVLDDYTGNKGTGVGSPLWEALRYGTPPLVTVGSTRLDRDKDGRFTGGYTAGFFKTKPHLSNRNLDNSIITLNDIYGAIPFEFTKIFDSAINKSNDSIIYAQAFRILETLLHELVHCLRWYNRAGPKFSPYFSNKKWEDSIKEEQEVLQGMAEALNSLPYYADGRPDGKNRGLYHTLNPKMIPSWLKSFIHLRARLEFEEKEYYTCLGGLDCRGLDYRSTYPKTEGYKFRE